MRGELEQALRGAFALDQVPTPGSGFEARMARAARARGGMRRAPLVLAAFVAGAAAATLAIGRDRGLERPVALRAARPPVVRPAGGESSAVEVWELVIRLSRSWTVREEDPAPADQDRAAIPEEPPKVRRRHRPPVVPRIDCGDDPLCPLVAPNAARLMVAMKSTSSWGRVHIDGQDAGPTPLDIEVIPGRHRVVVVDGNGARRTYTVDLRPGARRTLFVTLSQPP